MRKHAIAIILFIFFFGNLSVNATDYYIDATNGNDSNNGISSLTAWQTLANINTTVFQPGDTILLVSKIVKTMHFSAFRFSF